MAEKQPTPLVGRLAIQLKMLTPQQVQSAMAESRSSGNPRLAQVFLQMGLLDRAQIAKLQQVQKDLVEKHRAQKGGAAPAGSTPAAQPERKPSAAEQAERLHAAAGHAARAAAPMTGADVDALHEAPPEAANPGPKATPDATAEPPTPSAASSPAQPAAPTAAPPAESPVQLRFEDQDARRSLEIAVPEAGAADRQKLEAVLSDGVSRKASDIHLHAGGALKQRVNGEFVVVEENVESAAVEAMVAAALSPDQRDTLARTGEVDFCFALPGVGRFRANAYRQQRGIDAVFRTIPEHPPTLEELGLPAALEKHTDYHQGMVLITGPAGCGKSATMAALVNHINERRTDHILTVEDPIEILHPSKSCLVNQRHAGSHTSSFARALRGALREDPDIIVIGELRDLETISLAMTAAETGHFVLATLHTANAVRTINRMIGAFPSNEQDQIRAMLSESLKAVVSQRLVPTADGQGRLPALELLVINRAIGNLIRDEKTIQIRSSMQTGKAHGMYLLEQSLNELVAAGKITRDVALGLAEEEKLITAGA
jgi:twitching motility protein PilT